MSINLDEININTKKNTKKLIWREIKDFFVIFTIVLGFGWLFINAQLIIILIENITGKSEVVANEITLATPVKKISLNQIENNIKKKEKINKQDNNDNLIKLQETLLNNKLDNKLKNIKIHHKNDIVYKPKYNNMLKKKIHLYNIKFNTLPPDYRLVIPKL
jgi:hypothetical protein